MEPAETNQVTAEAGTSSGSTAADSKKQPPVKGKLSGSMKASGKSKNIEEVQSKDRDTEELDEFEYDAEWEHEYDVVGGANRPRATKWQGPRGGTRGRGYNNWVPRGNATRGRGGLVSRRFNQNPTALRKFAIDNDTQEDNLPPPRKLTNLQVKLQNGRRFAKPDGRPLIISGRRDVGFSSANRRGQEASPPGRYNKRMRLNEDRFDSGRDDNDWREDSGQDYQQDRSRRFVEDPESVTRPSRRLGVYPDDVAVDCRELIISKKLQRANEGEGDLREKIKRKGSRERPPMLDGGSRRQSDLVERNSRRDEEPSFRNSEKFRQESSSDRRASYPSGKRDHFSGPGRRGDRELERHPDWVEGMDRARDRGRERAREREVERHNEREREEREREREIQRERVREIEREREREIQREREREIQREREREMEREREREMQREREREIERQRQREIERQREKEERQRKLERERELERERKREMERERERLERERERIERDRQERQKELERQREVERQRELLRQRELERQKEVERQREVERLELERKREVEKQRELERERERQRELERKREIERESKMERDRKMAKEREMERERERDRGRGRERERDLERFRGSDRGDETLRLREVEREKEREKKMRDKEREKGRLMIEERGSIRDRERERMKDRELERERSGRRERPVDENWRERREPREPPREPPRDIKLTAAIPLRAEHGDRSPRRALARSKPEDWHRNRYNEPEREGNDRRRDFGGPPAEQPWKMKDWNSSSSSRYPTGMGASAGKGLNISPIVGAGGSNDLKGPGPSSQEGGFWHRRSAVEHRDYKDRTSESFGARDIPNQSNDESNEVIFILGLAPDVTELEIRQNIRDCDLWPSDVQLLVDSSGKSQGIMVVTFNSKDEAYSWMSFRKGRLALRNGNYAPMVYKSASYDWMCVRCNVPNYKNNPTCCSCKRIREECLDGYEEASPYPTNALLLRNVNPKTTPVTVINTLKCYMTNLRLERLQIGPRCLCFLELTSVVDALALYTRLIGNELMIDKRQVVVSYARLECLPAMADVRNDPKPAPSLPPASYMNTYGNPMYGGPHRSAVPMVNPANPLQGKPIIERPPLLKRPQRLDFGICDDNYRIVAGRQNMPF